MKETRKKLTDVQAKHLSETQATLTETRTTMQAAEKNAAQVLTLIFDALGLSPDATVRYDDTTRELVIVESDTAAAAPMALV